MSPNKASNFGGSEKYSALTRSFAYPRTLAPDSFALQGKWLLDGQYITPRDGAAGIRLNYQAKTVRMVLAGEGEVTVVTDGTSRTISVSGTPKSYELIPAGSESSGELEVRVSRGVQAFSFTFG